MNLSSARELAADNQMVSQAKSKSELKARAREFRKVDWVLVKYRVREPAGIVNCLGLAWTLLSAVHRRSGYYRPEDLSAAAGADAGTPELRYSCPEDWPPALTGMVGSTSRLENPLAGWRG